jgi:hypothetical protein
MKINGVASYYTGCLKNSFTMVFKMLLCGRRYEEFTLKGVKNYPSLKVLNDE